MRSTRLSSARLGGGFRFTATTRGLPTNTMRPRTLALSFANATSSWCWVGLSGRTRLYALAITTPGVLGVQASTSQTSESFTGEIMCAVSRSFSQPGCLKSYGSRWPLTKPQPVICLMVHSAARL